MVDEYEISASEASLSEQQRHLSSILRLAWASWEFRVGLVFFVLLFLLAVLGPILIDISPTKIHVSERFIPPLLSEGGQLKHIFGTDQLGRDLFIRSLIGLRNALLIGIVSVILMFALGCLIGIIAGFKGGWIDIVLMRITDAQMSIPVVILAIVILGISRPNVFSIIAVLVLGGWPVYARVVRSVALTERRQEYVRGATILGASDFRIMLRYIAPNILPPIALVGVLDVARMMIFETIFAFIGIGIQPPTPTFGTIIADGTSYLLNAWWITTIPGILLTMSLCSISLMGGVLDRIRNRILTGIE